MKNSKRKVQRASPARKSGKAAPAPSQVPPSDPTEAPRTSGYDRDLFERVLKGVNDPGERVKTILLWRGFLARRDAARVFLCTGSASDDVKLLQQIGFTVNQIYRDQDRYAEIHAPSSVLDETLFELFSYPPECAGLAGPFDWGGWQSFLNCKFGAQVPVRFLDPGIALLVKTLPLLGLRTVECCDGHLIQRPRICFINQHHWNWARLILPLFARSEEGVRYGRDFWDFRGAKGGKWEWCLKRNGCGGGLLDRFAFYSAIQKLALNIMEGSRTSRLRERKQRLRSAEALQRAADLRRSHFDE